MPSTFFACKDKLKANKIRIDKIKNSFFISIILPPTTRDVEGLFCIFIFDYYLFADFFKGITNPDISSFFIV